MCRNEVYLKWSQKMNHFRVYDVDTYPFKKAEESVCSG